MSDSFADLWNISAPLPAKPKPQTLTLAARLAEENNKRHRATTTTTTTTTTTVDLQSHKAPDISNGAWAGLDSLDSGIKVKVDDGDDWGLRDFGSAAVNSNSNPKSTSTSTSKTLWDLDDFVSSTESTPPRSTTASYLKPQSRPITRSTSSLSHHSSSQVRLQNVNSPDMDFDFGSREDQDDDRDLLATNSKSSKSLGVLHLLDDDNDHDNLMDGISNHEDEEDILGVLSKPVEVVIAKKVFYHFTVFSFLFIFSDEMVLILFPFFRTRIQELRRPSHILHHYLDKIQDLPLHLLTS